MHECLLVGGGLAISRRIGCMCECHHTYELITARSRRPNGVIGLFVRRLMMSVLLRGAWLQPEGKVGHEHPAVPGDAVSRTPGFDRLGKEEEAQALVGAIGLCSGADALAGLMSRLLRDAR